MKTDEDPVSVVQKNGLVTRMIKLVKVRGFSSDGDAIDIHVKFTQNSFWRFIVRINFSDSNLRAQVDLLTS